MQDTITAQRLLLFGLLRIAWHQTLRDRNKSGVHLLLNVRDNVLPLNNDHAFKLEFLILTNNILGCYYRGIGKFKRAMYHLSQAKSLLGAVKPKYLSILTLNNTATVLMSMGIYPAAAKHLQEALRSVPSDRISQGKSNLLATICYNNLGVCLHALGNKDFKSAFQHSNDFENDQSRPLLSKIQRNLQFLLDNPNATMKTAPSLKTLYSQKETIQIHKDYSPFLMDLLDNLEFICLLDQDFYFDYAKIEPKPLFTDTEYDSKHHPKRPSTAKDREPTKGTTPSQNRQWESPNRMTPSQNQNRLPPFLKLEPYIEDLEAKGILTWDQEENSGEKIEYHGEKVLKKLKSFERKQDVGNMRRYESDGKFNNKPQGGDSMGGTERKKMDEREETYGNSNREKEKWDLEEVIRMEVEKRLKKELAGINKKELGREISNKDISNKGRFFDDDNSKKEVKKEAKKMEMYREKSTGNMMVKSEQKTQEESIIKEQQEPFQKEIGNIKQTNRKEMKKAKSEIRFSNSEKNFKIHKSSLIVRDSNPPPILMPSSTPNPAPQILHQSSNSEKKPRSIILLHQELSHQSLKPKKPSESHIFPHEPNNQYLPKKPVTFEPIRPRNLAEQETQINPSEFRRKKSSKLLKTVEFTTESQKSKEFQFRPLSDYKPREIAQIKKIQRFFRDIIKRRMRLRRRKVVRMRKSAKKIQNAFRKYMSKRHFGFRSLGNSQNTRVFGSLYRKLNGKVLQVLIFHHEDDIVYRFFNLTTKSLEKTVRIPIIEFKDYSETPYVFRKALKSRMEAILLKNFSDNKPSALLKPVIEPRSPPKSPPKRILQQGSSKRLILNNNEIPKKAKRRTEIIVMIQRRVRLWLMILAKRKKLQKSVRPICQRIDRIDKGRYLSVEAYEDAEHCQILIRGKLFHDKKTLPIKSMMIPMDIVSLLIEPLSRANLWDLLGFNEEKTSLILNDELAYRLEKLKDQTKPIPRKPFPLFPLIMCQKRVKEQLRRKQEQDKALARAAGKVPDISRHFKLYSNEIFLVKASLDSSQAPPNHSNTEKIGLKICGFVLNKARNPLKSELKMSINPSEVDELGQRIVHTARIRRSVNKEYFIHCDDKLFRNIEEFTPGYGIAFLRHPPPIVDLPRIRDWPMMSINRLAVKKISMAWLHYKFLMVVRTLGQRFRRKERLSAVAAMSDELKNLLGTLQINQEEKAAEENRLAAEKGQKDSEKHLLLETLKQFSVDVVYLIKIYHNVLHKTLIIHCDPQPRDRESKEFHVSLHLLSLKEIPNLEQFRAIHGRIIINSLYYEDGQLIQKLPSSSLIASNLPTPRNPKESLMKPFTKEKPFEINRKKDNNAKEAIKNLEEQQPEPEIDDIPVERGKIIQSFLLQHDDFRVPVTVFYDETIGEIKIHGVIYLNDRLLGQQTLILTWFQSSDSRTRYLLCKVLREARELQLSLKLSEVPQPGARRPVLELSLEEDGGRLYKTILHRMDRQKAALKLQQAWRGTVLRKIYIGMMSKRLNLLTVQVQVLQGNYFRVIFFSEVGNHSLRVKVLEVPRAKGVRALTGLFSLDVLRNFRDDVILASVLRNGVALEIKDDGSLGLICKDPCLKLSDHTPAKEVVRVEGTTGLSPVKVRKNQRFNSVKTSGNSLYILTKLLFYIKSYKMRKDFLQHKEIQSFKRNAPLFLKSVILKTQGYYMRMNCFFLTAEQQILLSFVNLNMHREINARYSIDYYWKTYPNRLEIYRYIDKIKGNLFFSFVYGNITAAIIGQECVMTEVSSKKNKREAGNQHSKKLMHLISSIIMIQRAFRKKTAREMKELRVESTKIKSELAKLKNGKLNLSKVLKMGDEYFRVHIYQSGNKFSISARPLSEKSEARRELRTELEMDDNFLLNTGGEGLERFFVKNLRVESDKLKLIVSEKLSSIAETQEVEPQEPQPQKTIRDFDMADEIEEFNELDSGALVKYEIKDEEYPIRSITEEEEAKEKGGKRGGALDSLETEPRAEIVHQEEIEGNLFNVFYQRAGMKAKPRATTSTRQKTVQIDVKVDDLKTYNPGLNLNSKDSLRHVAEVLTRSVKINQDGFFIDSRSVNPESLTLKRIDETKDPKDKKDKKLLETSLSKISHYQQGAQKLINSVNEKRKVILKQAKLIGGKQYLLIINYLERPLKKVAEVEKAEFLEDYEVLFEVKATMATQEKGRTVVQIDLTLGEMKFLCNMHNQGTHRGSIDYPHLAQIFSDRLVLFKDFLIYEVRYKIDHQTQLQLNHLSKKLAKKGSKHLIFVNVVSIRKCQAMFRNKSHAKNFIVFRTENINNKKVIGKIAIVRDDDEILIVLKDLNSYDIELAAWDIRTFAIKTTINLKKELYNRFLGVYGIRRNMLEIMRSSISVFFVNDSNNKPSLTIYYDEEKALKHLGREEKKYMSRTYKEELRREMDKNC